MYLTLIEIANLRCFSKTSVQLNYPGRLESRDLSFPNANLFLGQNGSGKSTLLKAVAMAAMAPVLTVSGSGFRPYYLVRRNHGTATIAATLRLAEAEGLGAHGRSVSIRLNRRF